MKVKQLIVKNVGMIKDETIELNKPLVLFYGDIKQGKTTILNAVKWLFGGSFPTDIIRHGESTASAMLVFENGSISREWYVAKDGSTKAREIQFIFNGCPVKRPVEEIKKFLNPYLLDNEYLKKMSEQERKSYFAQLFSVDTAEADEQQAALEAEAKELRAKLRGYGEIDLTPAEPIDATALREELKKINQSHNTAVSQVSEFNSKVRGANGQIHTYQAKISTHQAVIREKKEQISKLQKDIQKLEQYIKDDNAWIEQNPAQDEKPYPEKPDTSHIEAQINEAAANQVRVEQHQRNRVRANERDKDQAQLAAKEKAIREIKQQKIAQLKEHSETCGVPGLSFNEDGNFVYDGTQAGMLSTSQIMELSNAISSLYPPGFGLDLIDRGESLGKSIFTFVERAEREEKTILATIVGEKPAEIPEKIGVFVVEDGTIKK